LSWFLTVFENFTLFTVAMPIQGCGVARNQKLFGGVGLLTTLGVGVRYFVRLREVRLDNFYITFLCGEFLLNR